MKLVVGAYCAIFSAKLQFIARGAFQVSRVNFCVLLIQLHSIAEFDDGLDLSYRILFSLFVFFQMESGGVRFNAIIKLIVDLIPDDAPVIMTEEDEEEFLKVMSGETLPENFEGHGDKTKLFWLVRSALRFVNLK